MCAGFHCLTRCVVGVLTIHCFHYHEEDIDHPEHGGGIDHYITFNLDTGYICLYPEVIIFTDEDAQDMDTFFKKLERPPYLLKFHADLDASR